MRAIAIFGTVDVAHHIRIMKKASAPLILALGSFATLACSQPIAETQTQSAQFSTTAPRTATRGLDPVRMQAAVQRARGLPRLRALLVARHGDTLAEHRLAGPALDTPVNIKSASKSVLSALAGIAIGRGVLTGVDQKIAPVLRADLPPNGDPRLAEIDVADLLTMRAGLGRTSGANYGAWVASPNWVRYALARPFDDDPGGRMLYSTGSSHLMSAVLTRASGRSTHDLATDWLARPLGVTLPPWPRDAQGVYFGGNDMLMSPRALLAFGELYRQNGVIDGRRILPAGWVEQSWTPRTISPFNGHGYGYGWFAKRVGDHDVRFAWGYGGQMLFVVPDLALSVVMISDPSPQERGDHLDQLHALLDEAIIPAAEQGTVTS